MLMVSRRAGEGERELRAGEWHGWRPTHLMGRSLCGKTLGIIGMGRIGKAVAHRAALGFGMKIIFFNRSRVTDITDYEAKQIDDLELLCAQSDFLSLHCAASADTFHILNEERLKCMQAHAYVINTARGDVIDEAAAAQNLLPPSRRRQTIGQKDIEATIATMARIPSKHVSRDDKEVLASLENDLKRLVFGQDEAITALASAIKLSRAGLRELEKLW